MFFLNLGGASLWVLKGHTPDEYKAAAAFLNFIAQHDLGMPRSY